MTTTHCYYTLETAKNFLFLYSFEYALNDLFCLDVHEYGLSTLRYSQVIAEGANLSSLKRTDKEREVVFNSAFAESKSFKQLFPIPTVAEWYYPRVSSLIASVSEMWNRNGSYLEQQIQWIAGAVFGWFTPTLSVKALPSEKVGPFDDVFVERDQMGLYGTFKKGLEGGLWGRIQQRPAQFLWGLIKLVGCIAIPIFLFSSGMITKSILIAKLAYDTFYALSSCLPTSVYSSLYSCKMF